MGLRIAGWLGLGAAGSLLAGCALLSPLPEPSDVAGRLATFPTRGLPLQGEVTVHWNERQIPFIEAEHDRGTRPSRLVWCMRICAWGR